MREILFRGKTPYGRWVYGSLIHAGDYCCILENEGHVHPIDWPYLDGDLGTFDGKATPIIPETIGQFTDLLDANGKKIFEGDILKCRHCGELRSVVFDTDLAEFEFDTNDPVENPDGTCLCADHDIFEVIDNIHEGGNLNVLLENQSPR